MGLKNSQYQAIMRKYEQKQLRNHDILTQHYEEVYRQLPEFKSLDDSISILSVQYGKRLLNGDQKAISSLKEELAILRASKQELLRSSGFPADYLEPVYDVDAQNMFELIYNCDCLIIDDLGTEYTNNFIASQFFTCINERLLNSRSTIISTNLSLDTLADLYTERSFSRITSNYIMLKLIGDDIRIKKKLKNREEN